MEPYLEEAERRFSDAEIKRAHKHTIFHAHEIGASTVCVCMYCGHEFHPAELGSRNWTDLRSPKGTTALCSQCGIDAVIGDASGFPVTDIHFKARCTRAWFNGYSRMEDPDTVPAGPPIRIDVD
jgi:hypothetical protein